MLRDYSLLSLSLSLSFSLSLSYCLCFYGRERRKTATIRCIRVFFRFINAFSIEQAQWRSVHISFRRRFISQPRRGNTYTYRIVLGISIKTGQNRDENWFHRRNIAAACKHRERIKRTRYAPVFTIEYYLRCRGICIWILHVTVGCQPNAPRFRLQADPLAQRISLGRAATVNQVLFGLEHGKRNVIARY